MHKRYKVSYNKENMKKKNEILFVISLVILAIAWRLIFWSANVYGPDSFYHYTVVEQALEKNKLSNNNDLALCYEGVHYGHPYGYYALLFYTAKIIGLEKTFIYLPVILGAVSLLLAYLLIRTLFNKKIAGLTLFLGSISLAHVSKSYPYYWRGENLIYPFLLGSLILLYDAISKDNKRSAIFAGILSGSTLWFWNGHPLAIIVFFMTIISTTIYQYIRKEKGITSTIKLASISIIAQSIVYYSIFFTSELWGRGLIFSKFFYGPLTIGMLLGLGVMYISYKQKTNKYIVFSCILAVIAGIVLIHPIMQLVGGLGSLTDQERIVSPELEQTQLYQYFFGFQILSITGIFGIYTYLRRFNTKKAFFLGLLAPSLYLLFFAVRYIFFAAIPYIVLTSMFLSQKKVIKKKYDIFVILTMLIVLVTFAYSLYAIPFYFEQTKVNDIDHYYFLKDNTESDACVLDMSNRGAIVEFISKRHIYLHSLGNNQERIANASLLFMSNDTYDLGIKHLYVLVHYDMLSKINFFNFNSQKEDVGFFRTTMPMPMEEDYNMTQIKEELDFMRYAFVDNQLIVNESGVGCVYFNKGDEFYFKDGVCDTVLYRMATNQTVKEYRNIYFERGYSIYKYEPTKSP